VSLIKLIKWDVSLIKLKNYYECREGSGFIGWKNINYVIAYTPEEKPNKYNLPVFETWRGVEKREE